MSIKSIQKKLQLQSLHSISINYIQKTSENILWHPKCNELQLAGLASQISCLRLTSVSLRSAESSHASAAACREWTMDIHEWVSLKSVEICWIRFVRLNPMTACHLNILGPAITPMTEALGVSKAVAICHWPCEIAMWKSQGVFSSLRTT